MQGVYQLLPRTGLAQGARPGTRIKPLLHACIKKPVVLPLRGKVQCLISVLPYFSRQRRRSFSNARELHRGKLVRHAPGDKVNRTGLLPVWMDRLVISSSLCGSKKRSLRSIRGNEGPPRRPACGVDCPWQIQLQLQQKSASSMLERFIPKHAGRLQVFSPTSGTLVGHKAPQVQHPDPSHRAPASRDPQASPSP